MSTLSRRSKGRARMRDSASLAFTLVRGVPWSFRHLEPAPAFKAVERLFGAEVEVSPNERRRGVNFFVEVAGGNHLPIRLPSNHTDCARFAGEVNFAVPGYRRGKIIANSRHPLLGKQPAS